MHKLFEIQFEGVEELEKLAEERARLLLENIQTAVQNTTLLGIARIANDCPVDTGRLMASITGDYASQAGVQLKRGKISEGKKLSRTKIDLKKLEGTIGTNVEYALYQEYGHRIREGTDPKNVHKRINKRAGKRFKVKGRGFFRKNIPIIERHFNLIMREAIKATAEGRSLRKGE